MDQMDSFELACQYAQRTERVMAHDEESLGEVLQWDYLDGDELFQCVIYDEIALEYLKQTWVHGEATWNYLRRQGWGIFPDNTGDAFMHDGEF